MEFESGHNSLNKVENGERYNEAMELGWQLVFVGEDVSMFFS
jgi:hypothetical protein